MARASRLAAALSLGALFFCSGHAFGQESLVLLPATDTSIISSGVNPRGNETILAGTRRNGILDRGLLRFDLSALPPGAVISAARLRLTVVMIPQTEFDSEFALYRALKAWDETADWTQAASGHSWGAPGGLAGEDYAVANSAQKLIQDLGSYEFSGAGLVADVQQWATNKVSNLGWFLISADEGSPYSARHFGAKQSSTPPELMIDYTLAVAAPVLKDVQAVGNQFSFSFDTTAGGNYRVEGSPILPATSWITVTNLVATGPIIRATLPIDTARRFYRVAQ